MEPCPALSPPGDDDEEGRKAAGTPMTPLPWHRSLVRLCGWARRFCSEKFRSRRGLEGQRQQGTAQWPCPGPVLLLAANRLRTEGNWQSKHAEGRTGPALRSDIPWQAVSLG